VPFRLGLRDALTVALARLALAVQLRSPCAPLFDPRVGAVHQRFGKDWAGHDQ
jgi:hypothetical protein